MHITTPITQSNSRLTIVSPKTSSLLPAHIKQALQQKDKAEYGYGYLSAQLTRLVDSCGDCI